MTLICLMVSILNLAVGSNRAYLLLKRELVDESRRQKLVIYMGLQEQIDEYISSLPGQKRSDMKELHRIIFELVPACKLWFLDGKDSEGKTVSNPNIGY